ncbi:MAG TPA: hypothetical protein VMX18_04780 [Candidatus Bipolaricaulota bacterium]|nr:hypothetical protein [Candidatus Bipolaricaulota bacterium]
MEKISLMRNNEIMLYLIGVDHKYQHISTLNAPFEKTIKNLVKQYQIQVLAEEFNQESLSDGEKESTCQKIVNELINNGTDIKHLFCEMDKQERQRIGMLIDPNEISKEYNTFKNELRAKKIYIKTTNELIYQYQSKKGFWSKRENHWLNQLSKSLNENKIILFICGSSHIINKSFTNLLKSKNIDNKILIEDIDEYLDKLSQPHTAFKFY